MRLRFDSATAALLLIFSLFPCAARAAQKYQVTVDSAEVKTRPSDSAESITHLDQGTIVNGSSQPRDGWYKIKLPEPTKRHRFGWVRADDVDSEITAAERPEKARSSRRSKWKAEREYPLGRFYLRAGVAYHILTGSQELKNSLRTQTGKNVNWNHLQWGGEVGLRLSPRWQIALGAGTFSSYRRITISSTAFELGFKGQALELWLSHVIQSPDMVLSAGLGTGALFSKLEVIALSSAEEQSYQIPVAAVRGSVFFPFKKSTFGIYSSLGYRHTILPAELKTFPLHSILFDLGFQYGF